MGGEQKRIKGVFSVAPLYVFVIASLQIRNVLVERD